MSPISQIHDVNIVIEDSCNCCCCLPRFRSTKHNKSNKTEVKTDSVADQSIKSTEKINPK